MIARITFSLMVLLLIAGCDSSTNQKENTIEGVWRISQIAIDGSEPNNDPLPSQIIFTENHYSIVWMPGIEAMRAFNEPWKPTDSEILQRFWEVTVNTGWYEVADNKIRTEPVIARFPEFMGGYMIYDYRWSDSELILTLVDEYSFDGAQQPWVAQSGGQKHLTLIRVSD